MPPFHRRRWNLPPINLHPQCHGGPSIPACPLWNPSVPSSYPAEPGSRYRHAAHFHRYSGRPGVRRLRPNHPLPTAVVRSQPAPPAPRDRQADPPSRRRPRITTPPLPAAPRHHRPPPCCDPHAHRSPDRSPNHPAPLAAITGTVPPATTAIAAITVRPLVPTSADPPLHPAPPRPPLTAVAVIPFHSPPFPSIPPFHSMNSIPFRSIHSIPLRSRDHWPSFHRRVRSSGRPVP